MLTKSVDSKGRIALGKQFANKTVIVTKVGDTELILTLAQLVPDREAWLYGNADALDLVRTGLQQARQGQISESPPDLDADAALVKQLED